MLASSTLYYTIIYVLYQKRILVLFPELARPYTPYVKPEVLAVAAVDTQSTTVVVQVVLTVSSTRSRGPPVAVASIVERAIEVVPASNRRKSGYVASTSNATKFIVGW